MTMLLFTDNPTFFNIPYFISERAFFFVFNDFISITTILKQTKQGATDISSLRLVY